MSTEWSVKDAVSLFFKDGKRDGDLLSHDWILFALDMRAPRTREDGLMLLDRMDSFRTALLEEHNIAVQNVRGEGYRVVPPAEQAEYAARVAARHIDKGIRDSNRLLKHTRRELLTDTEAKRHTDCEVRIAGLRGMIGKGKRDVLALFDVRRVAKG